ncbi:MAG: hypothetical protein P4L79_00105 [Legionella sp.]|uniref:hypothetical protein n=1 Tax=Legionella sp. TaxID=459 RepID=UPI00283F06BC|nr:hypothetical protein [Legionella sp.]
MARSAEETATVLSNLYEETFGHDTCEPFRITWPQLRSLVAVPRLREYYLKEVSEALSQVDRCLIPLNDFLFVAAESDLSHYRMVPDRLLEQYLPDPDDIELDDDEDEGLDDEKSE